MTKDQRPQFTSSPDQWVKLKTAAREMRHQPTAAEDALWERIRNRQVSGAKFRRQHSVEGFIVDFICVEQRLIVEVDGEVHNQPEQQTYDEQRQAILESRGFCVLRFTNGEVFQSLERVAGVISEMLTHETE